MKKFVWFIATFVALLLALPVGATYQDDGEVVIANRGSGSVSVIDVHTNAVSQTIALPAGNNTPEPMYVTYSSRGNHVFVGDRANNRVVVYDADNFSLVTTIPTGAGVFHMWSDPRDLQLWVNNDIDNTATVINPRNLSVITTVDMPADLVAAGMKPHDVILDPTGRYAYVTLVGGGGTHDYLVQYNTRTFTEVNRVPVGKDPHVSLTSANNLIYVPAQNSNIVSVFNRYTLAPVTNINVPGAHGAGMAAKGQVFYTTNLPNGGTDGLFAIDTAGNSVIGSTDTPFAVPHNIAVTNSNSLFVTHSGGTANKVTIYTISAANPVPSYLMDVTVGLNPFGLVFVP